MGAGLWLARTLCIRMTIYNSADGATVRLSAAANRTAEQP
jgi:hypothetical protein